MDPAPLQKHILGCYEAREKVLGVFSAPELSTTPLVPIELEQAEVCHSGVLSLVSTPISEPAELATEPEVIDISIVDAPSLLDKELPVVLSPVIGVKYDEPTAAAPFVDELGTVMVDAVGSLSFSLR